MSLSSSRTQASMPQAPFGQVQRFAARLRSQQSLLGKPASDGGERVGFQHHDPAALESNPIAVFPVAQLLVRALARHADHLPDFALGDRHSARLGNLGAFRPLQQGFRQPPGKSRNSTSSTCSDVWRRRAHSTSMSLSAISGWLRTRSRKSRRSITMSSQSAMAVASAVRGRPSSSAISPKISPSPTRLKTASLPSADGTLIFTVPAQTAYRLLPGSPLAKMVSPRWTARVVAYELSRSSNSGAITPNSGCRRSSASLSEVERLRRFSGREGMCLLWEEIHPARLQRDFSPRNRTAEQASAQGRLTLSPVP